jgi:hypothetical protein
MDAAAHRLRRMRIGTYPGERTFKPAWMPPI